MIRPLLDSTPRSNIPSDQGMRQDPAVSQSKPYSTQSLVWYRQPAARPPSRWDRTTARSLSTRTRDLHPSFQHARPYLRYCWQQAVPSTTDRDGTMRGNGGQTWHESKKCCEQAWTQVRESCIAFGDPIACIVHTFWSSSTKLRQDVRHERSTSIKGNKTARRKKDRRAWLRP